MKKALMLAPMGSVHRRFNKANIGALQILGYKVELVANFENGKGPEIHNQKYAEECRANGITIHSVPFQRHSLTDTLKCLPAIKQLLREGKYEIVHAHTESGGLILRLAAGIKGKSRFFYTPHGMSFWKGSSLKSQMVYKPLERWICSVMDTNLGMNKEEYDTLLGWNKQSAAYVHGIGLDLSDFALPLVDRETMRRQLGLQTDNVLILSVGELDGNKNHATVIKAISKLQNKKVHYCVCGVGPNMEILNTLIKEGRIGEGVQLLGYRSDIPDLIHAADIFVFPSFHEGLPVSVLEAMAGGLPIICSAIRGNVDLVKDGENGFLFRPADFETLSQKIELLVKSKADRERMGEMNKMIVKDYSLAAVTRELESYYR